MSTHVALLADVPLFQLIDDAERATLAELLTARSFDKGEAIFSEGDSGDELYLVREGRVQVFCFSDSGEKIMLAENGRGDVFGEISLLDGGSRTASAVAVEPTSVLKLDRAQLLTLIERHPHVAIDLLTVMGRRLRTTDELLRTHVTRNVNEVMEIQARGLERAADMIAAFSGSMPFLMLNALWFLVWILVNTVPLGIRFFDPYPFGLLTMIVSLEAIFLSCFVLVSQNRQSDKDRLRADLDYQVNLKAELEVAQLHRKLDRLYEEMHSRFMRMEKRPGERNGAEAGR